jgi:predicted ATPase
LPVAGRSAFGLDPEIKRETVWAGPQLRPSAVLCDRLGEFVKIRGRDGGWLRPCRSSCTTAC